MYIISFANCVCGLLALCVSITASAHCIVKLIEVFMSCRVELTPIRFSKHYEVCMDSFIQWWDHLASLNNRIWEQSVTRETLLLFSLDGSLLSKIH